MDVAKFLRTAFFIEHLRWLLLTVLPQCRKVSWGACSLKSRLYVRLHVLFWSKTSTKRCTDNCLLSRDNIISFLLELIYHVLSISEYILENHYSCFRFWWKACTKCYTNNYVICNVLKPCTCGWSSAFSFRI